ncbi:putative transcriptional regulator [Kerstersia gyiorum]|uniref:Putative transcriptional regulator n=1 Tax=Kerstersia gyiorum TaxID=206506 RepID=A0A4Q7MNA5_9BURK|nr:ASCH domain-containing protein [Kerstersia gyiorum]KAB0544428.1 ASCH domain-containing protein [Kerstersia gyiorum]RZS69557.1 putative transcriptional regulator [Kerstersia gyiorum]
MITPHNFLISLEERYANGIFDGTKTVELRRRPMNVSIGATVWIYVKMPVGSVVGCAKVTDLYTLAPSTLWKRFGAVSGLRRQEFFEYFSGLPKAFALGLTDPMKLSSPIPLDKLRDVSGNFHPPQFFINIASDAPLLHAMNKALLPRRGGRVRRDRSTELA